MYCCLVFYYAPLRNFKPSWYQFCPFITQSDMFGESSDQCLVFEALFGECQHGCKVQSGTPSCV